MKELECHQYVYLHNKTSRIKIWFYVLAILFILFLFLPWTQNIRARGTVTTLYQDQRPQQINTIIGGRIIKWYVKEGDMVNAGDTLLQLGEVNVNYLDPELIKRTKEQLSGKQLSVEFYKNKVTTAGVQMEAISGNYQFKLNQLMNKLNQQLLKIQADSAEREAAANEFKIADIQYKRQKAMFDSGLVSLTQLELANQRYQNALAKKIAAENKLANSRQDLSITQFEIDALKQENLEKLAKTRAEQLQSLSDIASNQAEIAKLQNLYASYSIRNNMYYILAPQSGQVVKARKAGIGEYVKEGEMIAEIVPSKIQYAVEMFVRPLDLPLLSPGQKVRFLFDGFPAIVFSGWPQLSSGTFGGIIFAIENNVNYNGKFRVLVKEDPNDKPWPKELKIGVGAQGIALLKDVPIWYELWRNINGFPPDYYKPDKNLVNQTAQ
ncbi:MAG: HlyD family efflux transporter periplasmic adaptor subunit [Chitinophagaceae bacterium]|nr:HlyD family efflux transporter periplasmic adaptor subunit [Chitinophagaceae bacterium]